MDFYEYFRSYKNYFWQWEENAEVVSVRGGSTIAYTEYIKEVIGGIHEQGLPPFGSLLLALLATGKTIDDPVNGIASFIHHEIKTRVQLTAGHLDGVVPFLKLLQALPDTYKSGPRRVQLIRTLFEDAHYKHRADASALINTTLQSGKYDCDLLSAASPDFNINQYIRELRNIHLLYVRYPDMSSLMKKIEGLPDTSHVPEFPDDSLPEERSSVKTDFVDELIDNYRTFEVGALVRRIWSGLNIPFHNVLPSDQPLGGISDISNKGHYDQLLTSEFANDDLLFLSRLANNEALYLRREVPPSSEKFERIILIDSSIRNWGTPRVIAHAIRVAIARHPKTDMQCTAYAIGNGWAELKHETTEDIADGLLHLDTAADAAAGLMQFFREHKLSSRAEVLFISNPFACQTAPMQEALAELRPKFHYWIMTEANGQVEVFRLRKNNRKLLQQFVLPLETLWKKPPRPDPESKPVHDTRLNYPILFPRPNSGKGILYSGNEYAYILSKHNSILKTAGRGKNIVNRGLVLTPARLPSRSVWRFLGKAENGEDWLLSCQPSPKTLSLTHIDSGMTYTIVPESPKLTITHEVYSDDGYFYMKSGQQVFHIKAEPDSQPEANTITAEQFDKNARRIREASIPTFSYGYGGNVFNKHNRVFIDDHHHLVFNHHRLALNQRHLLQFTTTTNLPQLVNSQKQEDENAYLFPDGSKVIIHPEGIFMLRSADTSLPTVYLPLEINKTIAAATDEAFSGNIYYMPGEHTPELQVMSMNLFYSSYILSFIQHIVKHATAH